MANTHIARSRNYLEQFGVVDKTEHYIAIPGRKFGCTRDLFGIFDLMLVTTLAYDIIGVQVTSSTNISVHKQKIENATVTMPWLLGHGSIHLHLWKKKSNKWLLKRAMLVVGADGLEWIDLGEGYEQPKKG